MASNFTHAFDQPMRVILDSDGAQPWQAMRIEIGRDASISLSYEEAAKLAADLLRELAVVEARARGVAA